MQLTLSESLRIMRFLILLKIWNPKIGTMCINPKMKSNRMLKIMMIEMTWKSMMMTS